MAGRLSTGALAARGATDPAAFAAFISNRLQGGQQVLGFASSSPEGGSDGMTCPNCGHSGPASDFTGGGSTSSDDALRTPAPDTGYVRSGVPGNPSTGGVGAPGLANPAGQAIGLASPRYPVTTATDVLVRQRNGGGAEIRHRRGGALIGEIVNDGAWKMLYGGKPGKGHPSSRAALAELVSTWNTGTATMDRPALQQPPVQTQLMQQYGVPAINALATPVTSSSSGARVTMANGGGSDSSDDDTDDNSSGGGSGLSPRGQAVYKKLKAKGWPDAKAMTFAKMADKNQGKIGG